MISLAQVVEDDFPASRRVGWPIATGVIEGACRHLVKDRMDLTGVPWGLPGAEAILSCVLCAQMAISRPTGASTPVRKSAATTSHATLEIRSPASRTSLEKSRTLIN